MTDGEASRTRPKGTNSGKMNLMMIGKHNLRTAVHSFIFVKIDPRVAVTLEIQSGLP